MLSLIGREIRDHLFYVLMPCFISLMMIVLTIRAFLSDMWTPAVFALAILMTLPLLLFCVLGSVQMYGDRINKISGFLSTLAVTRNRILVAKLVVGVLTVLATVVPLVVTVVILLRLSVPGAVFYRRMAAEVSVTVALIGFACYCVGLLIGWTTNRVWLLVGGLLLLTAVVSLVCIKGFGFEAMVILLLLIAAALVCVWHKFASASL